MVASAGSGKILVIRGGAIGDFVLTLPALRLIKETLPAAHLEVLGYRPMIDLAVMAGYADSVRSIEYSAMAGFFAPGSKLDDDLVDYFEGFSVVVSYLFDPDGFFRGNLLRAGVETIIHCPFKIDESGSHAVHQLAEPLEGLAMFLEEERVAPVIPDAKDLERTRIAWHPGSGGARKNWAIEGWIQALRDLQVQDLLVITGEAEEERLGEIEAALRNAGIEYELAHGLGFDAMVPRLREVRLLFGHDSGISHLAAACGAPCVIVFGPTNPAIWAPLNEGVHVCSAPGGDLSELKPAGLVELVRDRGLLD